MIKEVIFDIDNTLYSYDKGHAKGMDELCRYVNEHFQISREEFQEMVQTCNQEIAQRLGKDNAAIHSRSIRFQTLLEKWGKPLFPHVKAMYHAYWDTLLRESGPEPGAIACMEELKKMGVTVGIGTDMTAMMQYEKLEAFGFAPYITHIVTSQEAGVEKPHPDFMALCIRKAGPITIPPVKRHQTAFTGRKTRRLLAEQRMNGNPFVQGFPLIAARHTASYKPVK